MPDPWNLKTAYFVGVSGPAFMQTKHAMTAQAGHKSSLGVHDGRSVLWVTLLLVVPTDSIMHKGHKCLSICKLFFVVRGARGTVQTWKGMLGMRSRRSSRRRQGHSCRKRRATSKVAPPHTSRLPAFFST